MFRSKPPRAIDPSEVSNRKLNYDPRQWNTVSTWVVIKLLRVSRFFRRPHPIRSRFHRSDTCTMRIYPVRCRICGERAARWFGASPSQIYVPGLAKLWLYFPDAVNAVSFARIQLGRKFSTLGLRMSHDVLLFVLVVLLVVVQSLQSSA